MRGKYGMIAGSKCRKLILQQENNTIIGYHCINYGDICTFCIDESLVVT